MASQPKKMVPVSCTRHRLPLDTDFRSIEDPKAQAERIGPWTDDWQPQTAQEAELVCLGCGCRGKSTGRAEQTGPPLKRLLAEHEQFARNRRRGTRPEPRLIAGGSMDW